MDLLKESLHGKLVSLEPLSRAHIAGLQSAAVDPLIWQWFPFSLNDPEMMDAFVSTVEKFPDSGEGLPYIIRSIASGEVIGATGLWHIDHQYSKAELGASWLSPQYQRTGANTEAKYLLLSHGFEKIGCRRIGFSIHSKNMKSMAAVERIGATKEGVIRHDQVHHDGSDRDSVVYSILKAEWPKVKTRLEHFMAAHELL